MRDVSGSYRFTELPSQSELERLTETVREAMRWNHKKSVEAWHRDVSGIHRLGVERRRSRAADLAALQFKNASAMLSLAFARPMWVLQRAAEDFPRGPVFSWTDEQIGEASFWSKYLARIHDIGRIRPVMDSPAIWNMQSVVHVGDQVTIFGGGFGAARGAVVITDCNGQQQDVQIIDWRDDAVQVEVADDISGIPYDCQSSIEIRRPDGKAASKQFYLEPLEKLWWSTDSDSEAGYGGFSKEHTFESAVVPSLYHQFRLPDATGELHAGCVLFRSLADVFTNYDDDPVAIAITGGPAQVRDRIDVVTWLTDDFHYSFSITAEFYISAPVGFPTGPGWTTFSD